MPPPPTTMILTDTTGTASYYTNYPGVSLLYASLQMVSGIDPNVLLKYLPIFLVLPVFGAIPFTVRALGIDNDRAELIATAIVVFNSQIIYGTLYSTPASYGSILFLLGLAFFLGSISAPRPIRSSSVICFVAAACALAIYHVTSSGFLLGVTSLLTLILVAPQLRRRSHVNLGSATILLFMIIVSVWWTVYVAGPNMLSQLSFLIVQIIPHPTSGMNLRGGVLLPQSGAGKPLWMLLIEYLAFGAFGIAVLVSLTKAKDVFLAKLLTVVGVILALTFGSIWLLGVQLVVDMFYRSFFLLMVGAAPLVGAQFGKTMDGLSNTFLQRVLRYQNRNLVVGALITILVLNGVFFSFPLYSYHYSAPLQYDDSRYNLEKWQALGVFYSSHVDPNKLTFGPRLGQGIVGSYSGANYISFAFYGQPVRINASSFPSLPKLVRGNYVLISWDMLTAPAAPGYYPDITTPARISTRVYDNGQIVMLIAFAPDALVPTNSSP